MTRDELIKALEMAEGPSRELDAEIAALCAPTDDPRLASFASGDDYPRNYTSSLDAALTLVPEGWRVFHMSNDDGTWDIRLSDRDHQHPLCRWGEAEHKTPALALCIAALKAMEEKDG